MPSNYNLVCFQCRTVRRDKKMGRHDPASLKCLSCGNPCTFIGYKIAVPRKQNDKGWKQLREFILTSKNETDLRRYKTRLEKRNDIEKQIVELKKKAKRKAGDNRPVAGVKRLTDKLNSL